MRGGRRALVLLDQATARALPDQVAALLQDGAVVKLTDYSSYERLMGQVEGIRRILDKHQIDFVLFSRNDQVAGRVDIGPLIRALGVGYSSFSGIDSEEVLEQTQQCLEDYLGVAAPGDGRVAAPDDGRWTMDDGVNDLLSSPPSSIAHRPSSAEGPVRRRHGTFSLIFDLEQLGCARFGLPRILDLLDRHDATATFFTTNFIQEVYPQIPEVLLRRGYEIGLHGQYHEYLGGKSLLQQTAMISRMKSDFGGVVPVSGANFIFRMDSNTVEAMIGNGLDYFVDFMEHRYSPFAYRKMPLRPFLVWSPQGTIWMVPVSAQTYNLPWSAVKRMIDSAAIAGHAEGWPHINILLHPFRDGSSRHIGDLQRLLGYVQGKLGYEAVTLSGMVKQLPRYEPSSLIYYELDGSGQVSSQAGPRGTAVTGRFRRRWWEHVPRYQQRISKLYQELTANGSLPALYAGSASEIPPVKKDLYAVYPHFAEWAGRMRVSQDDPLLWPGPSRGAGLTTEPDPPNKNGSPELNAFAPGSYAKELVNATRALRPRFRQDYTGLLPEVALRAAYRLNKNRHIF